MSLFYQDDVFLEHDPGEHPEHPEHPERPERLEVIRGALEASSLRGSLEILPAVEVPRGAVVRVHDGRYVDLVREASERGGGMLDLDTYISRGSYRAALFAAGSVLDACTRVASGEAETAFCAVRPPGHHARRMRGMGFCLFNNVAVAARHLIEEKRAGRVAIVDFDVHHGNGTQEEFYAEDRVYYLSLHQYPHYPGTGAAEERGTGRGKGYTLNFPLPDGTVPREYLARLKEGCEELARFRPEMVIMSAGFDSYRGDPLAGLRLEKETYYEITRTVRRVVSSKAVSALEGGYDLASLGDCVVEHVRALVE